MNHMILGMELGWAAWQSYSLTAELSDHGEFFKGSSNYSNTSNYYEVRLCLKKIRENEYGNWISRRSLKKISTFFSGLMISALTGS